MGPHQQPTLSRIEPPGAVGNFQDAGINHSVAPTSLTSIGVTASIRTGIIDHRPQRLVRNICDGSHNAPVALDSKALVRLNAHGGNVGPGQAALYEVQMRYRDEHDLWLAFATWFTVAAPQIAALDVLEQKRVSHASELETSMILSLRPELVRMDAARGASTPSPSDVRLASRVTVVRAFERLSATGALGHPEQATVEKGQVLFDVAVNEIVSCVREVVAWEPFAPG